MPRYLRWIAAVTTGIVIQFAFQVLVLAIAVGSKEGEEVTLNGGVGALITFGATVLNVIAALAVNDWLAKRYPVESATTSGGASEGERAGSSR
jgi:Na+/citrate or Na+/malate symporter